MCPNHRFNFKNYMRHLKIGKKGKISITSLSSERGNKGITAFLQVHESFELCEDI